MNGTIQNTMKAVEAALNHADIMAEIEAQKIEVSTYKYSLRLQFWAALLLIDENMSQESRKVFANKLREIATESEEWEE
jgi:flagellar biosynthesis regulator FlbT